MAIHRPKWVYTMQQKIEGIDHYWYLRELTGNVQATTF